MASLYSIEWMRKGISGVVRVKLKVSESSRVTQKVTAAEVVVARRAAAAASPATPLTGLYFLCHNGETDTRGVYLQHAIIVYMWFQMFHKI